MKLIRQLTEMARQSVADQAYDAFVDAAQDAFPANAGFDPLDFQYKRGGYLTVIVPKRFVKYMGEPPEFDTHSSDNHEGLRAIRDALGARMVRFYPQGPQRDTGYRRAGPGERTIYGPTGSPTITVIPNTQTDRRRHVREELEALAEGEVLEEAEYQGRKVTLNKPQRGGSKKFFVYVKNDKGNVVKVSFGDPNMEIKRDDPDRRRAFRARHNCDNPGPKWKARYWSCKKW